MKIIPVSRKRFEIGMSKTQQLVEHLRENPDKAFTTTELCDLFNIKTGGMPKVWRREEKKPIEERRFFTKKIGNYRYWIVNLEYKVIDVQEVMTQMQKERQQQIASMRDH